MNEAPAACRKAECSCLKILRLCTTKSKSLDSLHKVELLSHSMDRFLRFNRRVSKAGSCTAGQSTAGSSTANQYTANHSTADESTAYESMPIASSNNNEPLLIQTLPPPVLPHAPPIPTSSNDDGDEQEEGDPQLLIGKIRDDYGLSDTPRELAKKSLEAALIM